MLYDTFIIFFTASIFIHFKYIENNKVGILKKIKIFMKFTFFCTMEKSRVRK